MPNSCEALAGLDPHILDRGAFRAAMINADRTWIPSAQFDVQVENLLIEIDVWLGRVGISAPNDCIERAQKYKTGFGFSGSPKPAAPSLSTRVDRAVPRAPISTHG